MKSSLQMGFSFCQMGHLRGVQVNPGNRPTSTGPNAVSDISKSRKDAWKTIASRQHEVIKVYSNISGSTTDLFVVGRLAMETVTGAASRKEFVARMEIEHVHAVGPRLRQYRIVNPVPSDVRPLLC